ncbi:MAG: succinylglutamate desuccinylase/aspartoacylase family protein, partial [Alphaproteobacteria bacterium]
MEAAISTQHITIPLSADTACAAYTVSYYHFIPDRKGIYPRIFLQAGLHADEQPGTLILHYLLDMLEQADKSGQLNAEFIVFPMVNPIG